VEISLIAELSSNVARSVPLIAGRYVAEFLANRISSSRNSTGVAFASRLFNVGLFRSLPRRS
jgi:hypothetical protein